MEENQSQLVQDSTTASTEKADLGSKKRKIDEFECVADEAEQAKPKSWVWDHFKKDKSSPKDKPKASCNYCKTRISCHPRNGTSAMSNHLGRCAGYKPNIDVKQKVLSLDKRGESETSNNLVSWSFSKEVSRDKCARMIVIDELPFSHVEGEGFIDFCYSLCPMFAPISRRTVCRDVLKLHLGQKAIIKDVFANIAYSVSLTKDLLIRLYDWYREKMVQANKNDPLPKSSSQQCASTSIGGSKMERHLKKMQVQDICSNEVDKYLSEIVEPPQKDFDIQLWWKVNGIRYKVLSDIARDVFAIPVSTVASESAFSTGGGYLILIEVA